MILDFPKATVTLSFCDHTGQGTIDYRHIETREQLATMLGCFMADLMAEGYLAEKEVRAVMETAIEEGGKANA